MSGQKYRCTSSLDHNLDHNSADDASGATDIRPRVDSSGIGRHHSNRA